MATFIYTARDRNGRINQGELEANDANNAADLLIRRDVIPVSIEPKTGSSAKPLQLSFWQRRVGLEDMVIFSRQMYSLTKSGIPILRAISGLAESTNSALLADALRQLAEQLERGRTLSSAMQDHPRVFSQLYISVIHVGENTGRLDQVFLQLSGYLERELETRKQIKAATRYPLFVVIALAVAMVILNIYVIPVFAQLFSKLGADLPPMTRVLIASSNLFVHYWPYMLFTVLAVIFTIHRYLQTEGGRFNFDQMSLRLPIIGDIIERSLLSRLCRSFAMMLRAGVPLTTSLTLVSDAVDNKFIGRQVLSMRRNIERGDSLVRAAGQSGLFPPLVMQMVSVGEETGQVDDMLDDVAEYYEREVDYDINNLTAKIEPVLIVLVAVMVLILALGVFTPMWDMARAYKGA